MRSALLVLLAACGGTASGLAGDERIAALGASERGDECQFQLDAHPERTIGCAGSASVNAGFPDLNSCVAPLQQIGNNDPSCTLTVSQYEACQAALYGEPDAYFCAAQPDPPAQCLPLHTPACSN